MKIRFAVIGTNKITDRFLEAAGRTEEFHLLGVYSRSPERAKEYGERHGATLFFDRLEDLAACREIDAVYVAQPQLLPCPAEHPYAGIRKARAL